MSKSHTDLSVSAGTHADAPFDTARVEMLRAAVRNGTYRIDARKIADRLIEWEKTLP